MFIKEKIRYIVFISGKYFYDVFGSAYFALAFSFLFTLSWFSLALSILVTALVFLFSAENTIMAFILCILGGILFSPFFYYGLEDIKKYCERRKI